VTVLREVTAEDIPALTVLQRAFDVAWFGAPEHDEDEVREWLDLGDANCVVEDGDRLIAAGSRWRTGSALTVDPGGDVDAALGLLVPWLVDGGAPETDVLEGDGRLRTALEAASWRHVRSAFELIRPVSPEWVLPAPAWPDGVQPHGYRPDDAARVHELIYMDAGWAEVPGHHERAFAEWRRLFLDGRAADELPVLAYRGDRLVGTAMSRTFSDGAGWVSQLAVARDERGRGLGRALLLEAFGRRLTAGATLLGVGVMATNRGALRLYTDVGLRIEREWQVYAPSASQAC
jgi:ribosomal protein S18 acetylase RimI-like enzyme